MVSVLKTFSRNWKREKGRDPSTFKHTHAWLEGQDIKCFTERTAPTVQRTQKYAPEHALVAAAKVLLKSMHTCVGQEPVTISALSRFSTCWNSPSPYSWHFLALADITNGRKAESLHLHVPTLALLLSVSKGPFPATESVICFSVTFYWWSLCLKRFLSTAQARVHRCKRRSGFPTKKTCEIIFILASARDMIY
jgi:hypothetical protein